MIRLAKSQEPTSHSIYDVISSTRQLGTLRSYLKPLYGPVREYFHIKLMKLIMEHVPCKTRLKSERIKACERGANFLLQKKIRKCGIVRFSRRVLIPEAYQLAQGNYPAWQPINFTFVYNFLAGAQEFHRLILFLLELDETERASLFSRACYNHGFDILDRYLGNKAWQTLTENVLRLPRPLCQTLIIR